MIRRADREQRALATLLHHLEKERGQHWVQDERPDTKIRNAAACDYVLTESSSGQRAALEITDYAWPVEQTTTQMRLRSLAESIEHKLAGALRGSYWIAADINKINQSNLFKPKRGPQQRKALKDWFRQHASELQVEEETAIPIVPGLRVTPLTADGDLSISVPVTSSSTHYPNWMLDLEEVIQDNARKFASVHGMSRWLLIPYVGIGHRLEVTGRCLEVPAEIDELFFIDYRDQDDERSLSSRSSRPYIVEYAKVQQKYVGEYDRTTGAYRVPVGALRPVRPQTKESDN